MQLHKFKGLQVRAGPNQSQPIKQKLNCGHSAVKITIEACVPRYFKVGISTSV